VTDKYNEDEAAESEGEGDKGTYGICFGSREEIFSPKNIRVCKHVYCIRSKGIM